MNKEEIVDTLTRCSEDLKYVNIQDIIKDVLVYTSIQKRKDAFAEIAKACTDRSIEHPNWELLAGRVQMTLLYEEVGNLKFSDVVKTGTNETTGESMFDNAYRSFVLDNEDVLDAIIDNRRNEKFGYFALTTLIKSYLLRMYMNEKDYKIIETPQQLYLRVATYMWMPNVNRIKLTYDDLSLGNYTHASPTLFNSGLKRSALSSCFLLTVGDDMDELGKAWIRSAIISMNKGGLGFDYGDIRHSKIGYHGYSKGLIPWLRIKNEIMNAVDQSSMRKGSAAIYIPEWHVDIIEFLDLKKPNGADSQRARDLFYAVWMSDLFMKRVEAGEMFSLFCPKIAKGLTTTHSDEFEKLYVEYEKKGVYSRQIPARELWQHILISQIENGMPYILYKDACNRKSNHKHMGTIKCSNLCVSGDTLILTDEGHLPIASLVDKKVNVWNGEEFSETEVVMTGKDQRLLTVYFDNGSELKCTPYHKFYIRANSSGDIKANGENEVVEADDLKEGMEIMNCQWPVINNTSEINKYLREHKNCVTTTYDGRTVYSMIFLSDFSRAIRIKYILQTLGCNPFITKEKNGISLDIDMKDLFWLKSFGAEIGIDKIDIDDKSFKHRRPVKVLKVLDNIEMADTYCFNEPKRHAGIFNGVLAGNCTEIIEYTSKDQLASCNLASICLNSCVVPGKGGNPRFDFKKLGRLSADCVRNLNKVIDRNYYPSEIPEIKSTNFANRPIGIGVQGLADTFAMMDMVWDSEEAYTLNRNIFETMYYYGMLESIELAREYGTYDSYIGSPASQGKLQFDMWHDDEINAKITENRWLDRSQNAYAYSIQGGMMYDWSKVREQLKDAGMRNSLLIALMPTATTAQCLNNNEAFEPFTQNIYKRTVLSGEFTVVNKHLVRDLMNINMWTTDVVKQIITNSGSVQGIKGMTEDITVAKRLEFIKEKYKTAYELSQSVLLKMGSDRARFVCQSQSHNVFIPTPTYKKLTSYHFSSWKQGQKTGMYYLRQFARTNPINYSLSVVSIPSITKDNIEEDKDCLFCGS